MKLAAEQVFVNGYHCMVMFQGMAYQQNEDGTVTEVPIFSVSRFEGAFVHGELSYANIRVMSPKVYIPPSQMKASDSEWYRAITGDE